MPTSKASITKPIANQKSNEVITVYRKPLRYDRLARMDEYGPHRDYDDLRFGRGLQPDIPPWTNGEILVSVIAWSIAMALMIVMGLAWFNGFAEI